MSDTIRTTVRLSKAAHDHVMQPRRGYKDMNEYIESLIQAERTVGPLVDRLEKRIARMEPLLDKGLRAMSAFTILAMVPRINPHLIAQLTDLIEHGTVTRAGDTITVNAPTGRR